MEVKCDKNPVITLHKWRMEARNSCKHTRAQIFKLLRSPGIDSKAWILPANVAWRAGTINPIPTRFLAPIDCLKIPAHTDKKENKVFLI